MSQDAARGKKGSLRAVLSRSNQCPAHGHGDGPPPISIPIPSHVELYLIQGRRSVKWLQSVARARARACIYQTDVPARLPSLDVMCILITAARRLGPIRFG